VYTHGTPITTVTMVSQLKFGKRDLRNVTDISSEYSLWDVTDVGSTGVVYCATQRSNGKLVAIKSLSVSDTDSCQSIQQELSVSSCNESHPCLSTVVDAFMWRNKVNIVMDLKSMDANQLMKRGLESKAWSTTTAFQLLYSLASAVRYLHSRGIAHRNIKLDSILIETKGVAKLWNLGFETGDSTADMSSVESNYNYSAPETLLGRPYDAFKADMWSIGVVTYALFIGKLPFISNSSVGVRKRIIACDWSVDEPVHPETMDFLNKLLCVSPASRMTIEQVVQHPFWMTCCKALQLDPEGIPAEVTASDHTTA